MKILGVVVLLLLLALLGVQVKFSLDRQRELDQKFRELQIKLQKAQLDFETLQGDIDFYSNKENLEKELRARFNYRGPDEELIIIVPKESQSSSFNSTP